MNRKLALLAMVVTVGASSPSARAQSPSLLPVQGQLADQSGMPIAGNHDLDLKVFDADTGGNVVHAESFPGASVTGGNFVVYLGTGDAIDLAVFRDQTELWLEVTVDGTIVQPRLRLGAAPYAGHAAYCGDAATLEGQPASSFAPAVHGHDASEIANVPAEWVDGDADALADLGASCMAGSAAQWDGAQWVCAPVAFDALAWPSGFSVLTTTSCPPGFTAVEAGYVKLSGAPSAVPTVRTLVTPGHSHSLGTAAIASAGSHGHTRVDMHYHDTGFQPAYATAAGDDVGEWAYTARVTAVAGDHGHTLSGSVGAAASGMGGDTDLVATGDLEHVAMRLCVKD